MCKTFYCFVCATAVCLFLCGCQKVVNLSPDLPKVSTHPVTFKGSQPSTIRMAVSISADDLQAIVNKELPTTFGGTDKPNIDDLTAEEVSWSLHRKDITIDRTDANGITLSCPVNGKGRLEAKALLVPFSATLDLSGTFVMRLAPELSEKWQVAPHFEIIEFRPKKAEIPLKLFGDEFATISVRDYVAKLVADKKGGWNKTVNKAIVEKLKIKADAEKAWHELHQAAKVATIDDGGTIGIWISILPKEVVFQKFDYSSNEIIQGGLGIVAEIQSVIDKKKPTRTGFRIASEQ